MVAPVAGALGYSLEDTSVALGLMANSGIKGSAAGTALRSALTNLVKPTAAMQKEMEKLGINVQDSNGEMKPLDQILRDLRGSFGNLTEAEKASAAATIFGKEAMSGMLAVINAGDGDFNKLTKAIANSEGVAQEMADTMQNNLQGKLTNLRSALEELAIKIYDALEPALTAIVNGIQSFVDKLNGMDRSSRNAIIAIAAIAAAIGPLMVVLGTLLTLTGGFMTTLPALLPLLSALAPPIGILVGALTALGVAYALTRPQAEDHYKEQVRLAEHNLELAKSYDEVLDEKLKQQQETSELIEATKEEIEVTNDLVDTFEGLIEKSKLSTDELGKFLTLQTELEHTKSPQKIAELEEKMEKLREKSGLSKEEFNRLLEANDQLTDKFPQAGQVVDEYGNKIADTTGKLREMTQAELERMGLEVYNQMTEGLQEVNKEIDNYKYLMGEIYTLEDGINAANKDILTEKEKIKQAEEEKKINNEEILRLQELQKDATALEYWQLADNITLVEAKNSIVDDGIEKNKKNIEELEKAKSIDEETIKKKEEQRDKIETLIDGNNQLYQQYIEMLQVKFDIVLEHGKENEQLDKAIKKRDEEIKKLEEKIKKEGDSNGKKQESIDKLEKEKKQLDDVKTKLDNTNETIESQNSKYEEVSSAVKKVKGELENVNDETKDNISQADLLNKALGEDVNKHVEVETSKDAKEENEWWRKPVTKTINFLSKGMPKFWATGTNYHPGGPAFLGDGNGPELVEHNGKMSIASFGLYDLPTGAKVHTYEDTISMLRNGLVDGIGRGVEVQRSGGFEVMSVANDYRDLINKTTAQVQLLKELVESSRNIEQKPVLSEGDIRRSYDKMDAKESKKHDIFTGKPRRD